MVRPIFAALFEHANIQCKTANLFRALMNAYDFNPRRNVLQYTHARSDD